MDTTLPTRSSARERRTAEAAEADATPEACCARPAVVPMRLDPRRSVALADRLKALADPTRLRILDLLAAQMEPLCVCDITSQFPQNQPTISHHLRILREAGLVEGEKRGVWGYYGATAEGRRMLSIVSSSL